MATKEEAEGAQWECKLCSYMNCSLLKACEMCGGGQGSLPNDENDQKPKMTPLIMLNQQGEKGNESPPTATNPLLAQLKSAKEVMEADKLSQSMEEEKLHAIVSFGEAATKGDVERILFFLQNFPAKELCTPGALHMAAEAGHLAVVAALIEHGYTVDTVLGTMLPDTPLTLAASGGHLEVVEYLLEKKADVNKHNYDRASGLCRAIKNGHIKVVETLVAHKASLKNGFEGKTPLIVACENERVDIARLLIAKGADANQTGGEDKCTALHAAARTGNLALVALLLIQPKIEVEIQDAKGRIPLQYALQTGSRVHAAVEELITTFWLGHLDELRMITETWQPEPVREKMTTMTTTGVVGEEGNQQKASQKELEELELRLLREEEKEKEKEKGKENEKEKEKEKEKEALEEQARKKRYEEEEKRLKKLQQEVEEKQRKKKAELEEALKHVHVQTPKEKEEEAKAREKEQEGKEIVIKVQDGSNNLRRFTFVASEDDHQANLGRLFEVLDKELGIRPMSASRMSESGVMVMEGTGEKLQVKYKDEDDDLVTICSGEDFAEAMRVLDTHHDMAKTLRLYIK